MTEALTQPNSWPDSFFFFQKAGTTNTGQVLWVIFQEPYMQRCLKMQQIYLCIDLLSKCITTE